MNFTIKDMMTFDSSAMTDVPLASGTGADITSIADSIAASYSSLGSPASLASAGSIPTASFVNSNPYITGDEGSATSAVASAAASAEAEAVEELTEQEAIQSQLLSNPESITADAAKVVHDSFIASFSKLNKDYYTATGKITVDDFINNKVSVVKSINLYTKKVLQDLKK